MLVSAIALVVLFIAALIAAERSLRRSRGSMLRRTPDEDRSLGRIASTIARFPGGGGS